MRRGGGRDGELAFCGLLPHPPICVPAVAGARGSACRATTEACRRFARRLVAARPARAVLVSPHSPRRERRLGVWSGARLGGDLGAFGARAARVDLPADAGLRNALAHESSEAGVGFEPLPPGALDHGAVVPLVFLAEAGWSGATTVLALPWEEDCDQLAAAGRCLARACAAAGGRSAIVASGDMSHRVLPGAPGGHHPRAVEFDLAVRDAVATGRLGDVARVDPDLRELAGEDVVASSALAIGALPPVVRGTEVLSYEHPFGVGYLVAVFHAVE